MTDTSAEAVERLAAFHALSVDRYCAEEESGLKACAHMTAATLRALVAERDAARAEAARLRDTAATSDDEDAITAEDEDRAFLGFSDEDDDE
jgi:hypothetical protein